MGQGVQDGLGSHDRISPDYMQWSIKMFSVPPTVVLHMWDDTYVLRYFNEF